MDALALELTAQITEQNAGISESVCIVQEAVKSGTLTTESLAKLNCRRGLITQIDSDREKILSDLPILRVIASQVESLESILANSNSPSFHTRGVSTLDPHDPEDFPYLATLHSSLGRLGMARYKHDFEQYSLWKAVLMGDTDLLRGWEIFIEYELKTDNTKKAYFDIRHLFLKRKINPDNEEGGGSSSDVRSNIG